MASTIGAATFAMGQVGRGANRIYGIDHDRPTLHKYLRALRLACSAGLLGIAAFTPIVLGEVLTEVLSVPSV